MFPINLFSSPFAPLLLSAALAQFHFLPIKVNKINKNSKYYIIKQFKN